MSEAELLKALKYQYFRLNTLYKIKNDDAKIIRFRLNPQQKVLYEGFHKRNIILKARQLGMTTFCCILALDKTLFNKNTSCGVIAQTVGDARKFFRNKIKFAYENLPQIIRNQIKANNDNVNLYTFSNGSSIEVGTSLRGDTLQYLHISEFGKICKESPGKAQEIITGAFNAVSQNGYISIESTAEGREGYYYDMTQDAMKRHLSDAELSRLDFKFFFFPWYEDPSYTLDLDMQLSPYYLDYFQELESKHGIKLTQGQRVWYVKKAETQRENIWREYPATADEAFKASTEGMYYRQQFIKIYQEKRIREFEDIPSTIHTAWDIGIGDSTAIWFYGIVGKETHVIDYYENSGEGLGHYIEVLRAKGYNYGIHYGPHDITNREFSSGASRLDYAKNQYGFKFTIVQKVLVDDGIDACRRLLPTCYFNESKTIEGVKKLENYSKDWDHNRGMWKDKPLHDINSHGADAFRYLAVSHPIIGFKDKERKRAKVRGY